jgi:SPP1 family predicted phage head-tail adaptor
MTLAGELNHRIAFDKREEINPDSPADIGNTQSEFVEQFTVWAKVQAKFGGEAVIAARLTGHQPVTIVVRQNSNTDLIAEDWQARDTRTGKRYAIRSIVDPDDTGAFYEILTQTGIAS